MSRSIDEAIEQFKYDAECNRADLDFSYAKEKDQLAERLEELKKYKENEFNVLKEDGQLLYKQGILDGYDKAIDDFVKLANTMPTVEEEDGTIRPMWLEEMAEKLKAGINNES